MKRHEIGVRGQGQTSQDVEWLDELDHHRQLQIMLDVVREHDGEPLVLCELGCGAGTLLSYIKEKNLSHIRYIGVDSSAAVLEIARRNHPADKFIQADVFALDSELDDLEADYLILNDPFTNGNALADAIVRIWPLVRRGIAFTVTSAEPATSATIHLPIDEIARVLHELVGRSFVLHADYDFGECTGYAYRNPPKARLGALPSVNQPSAPESDTSEVPVLRPLAATRDWIVPYLDRIDATRTYSNYGPLVIELGIRLSEWFGLPAPSVVGASSGTTALTAAILAEAGRATRERPLAVVPSFTFSATALAVEQCGYDVLLADIDAESWMLNPAALCDHPDLSKMGLVVPVAPFGRHIPQEQWLAFQRYTGIPVVIDAAACFEDLVRRKSEDTGLLATVLSFHATKSYSTGEGGAVLFRDQNRAFRVAQTLSFGFRGGRTCHGPGLNGKMSEYHAAVGLADLDMWPNKVDAFAEVVHAYEDAFGRRGLLDRLIRAPEIASCYILLLCKDVHEANSVTAYLTADRIAHRQWYGTGLHTHPHFRSRQRDALAVTENLTTRLIGLPAGPTLAPRQVERVAASVARGVQK